MITLWQFDSLPQCTSEGDFRYRFNTSNEKKKKKKELHCKTDNNQKLKILGF